MASGFGSEAFLVSARTGSHLRAELARERGSVERRCLVGDEDLHGDSAQVHDIGQLGPRDLLPLMRPGRELPRAEPEILEVLHHRECRGEPRTRK